MALDSINVVANLVNTIVQNIWPNKTEQEKAELVSAITLVHSQIATHQTETVNTSFFASGWRPFIGWACGSAYIWNWICLPIVKAVSSVIGHPVELTPADLSEMLPVLLGMLGLGTLRTVEKVHKVASK